MVLLAAGLSRAARQQHQFIRGGVSRGLSANEIGRQLRSQGRGIGRSDLQGAVRHFRGVEDTGRYLRSLRPTTVINPQRLRLSQGPHMRSEFRFEVSFQATDAQGVRKTRHIMVVTDRDLTTGEIIEEAEQALDETPEENESGGLTDRASFTFTGGFRRN